jgi:hypothetical protein
MGWNEKKQAPRSCHVTFTLLMLHTKDITKNHIFRTSSGRHFTLKVQCNVWVWSVSVSSGVFFPFRNEGGGFLRA